MTTFPPRPAERLLARLLPSGLRDDVLENLRDLYADRAARDGRRRANRWYWRQAVAFPVRVRLARDQTHPRGRRLQGLTTDAVSALRLFVREPSYAWLASGTLAVGLAANLLVFAVVNATLVRPLPWPQSGQLVWLWPGGENPLTHARFRELQRTVAPEASLTAWAWRSFMLSGGSRPVEVTGAAVSVNHFEVLGAAPARGRALTSTDARAGAEPVVLISHAIWRDWFGSDPAVVGRDVRLDVSAAIPMVPGAFTGTPRRVVGVLPPDYRPFGFDLDVVMPLVADPSDPNDGNLGELTVIGRLADDVALTRAMSAIDAATRSSGERDPDDNDATRVTAVPLRDAIVGATRGQLLIAQLAVGLLLLLASANVAHLMLARLVNRSSEFAIRLALGATRWRVARQLLVESLTLSVAGSAGGLLVAALLLPGVTRWLPHDVGLPLAAIEVDRTVVGFLMLMLVATALVVATLPMLRDPRRLAGGMRARGADGGGDRTRPLLHQLLVAAEMALAVTVVCGAGLLVASVTRLGTVDTGFRGDDVATLRVAPSDSRYRDSTTRRTLYAEALARVRALPGVESAGAIHFLPVADGGPSIRFLPGPEASDAMAAAYRVVTPGYFDTMGIPMEAGRDITDDDEAGAPLAGLVNARLAAELWPGSNAVGRSLYRTDGRLFFEVVGVVGDVRQQALGLPPAPEIYLPLAQSEWASAMTLVARAPGRPGGLLERLDEAVRGIDPSLPTMRLAWMPDLVSDSITTERAYSAVFSAFGIVALILGGMGVYGVASYLSTRRRREIGIRLALGATRRSILALELRRALATVAVGVGIGLAGALGAGRLLAGLLFDVAWNDPAVLASAIATIAAVALVGSYVPARRAVTPDRVLDVLR